MSCAGSIESVRRGKDSGVAVTAEVTPHHLLLTDEELRGYDTNMRMNPPLRPEEHRVACVEALAEGTIDCIATDHAPHPAEAPQSFAKRTIASVTSGGLGKLVAELSMYTRRGMTAW